MIYTDRVAGIDGDVLIYRSAFKAQYKEYVLSDLSGKELRKSSNKKHILEWQELAPVETEITDRLIALDPSYAFKALDRIVKEIIKNTAAGRFCIYVSGETNFRERVATTVPYKGNRVAEKPLAYYEVKEYIFNKYPHIISDNCEADDLLAIELHKAYEESARSKDRSECNFVVCTIDKDLNTVPGWHYNLNKKELEWINNQEAARFFYTQMITGDTVDNIKGPHGYGKAFAKREFDIVEEHPSYTSTEEIIAGYETSVINLYKSVYKENWYLRFIETGRLLHMQRYPRELWQPKTILNG